MSFQDALQKLKEKNIKELTEKRKRATAAEVLGTYMGKKGRGNGSKLDDIIDRMMDIALEASPMISRQACMDLLTLTLAPEENNSDKENKRTMTPIQINIRAVGSDTAVQIDESKREG